MPDEKGRETDEEARERVAQVRASQIFGDTPTDPTIGDVVVPAHDEEAANVASAAVDDAADEGDEAAADLSPEEAKRQNEPLSADDVVDDDVSDLTAAEKVERIEAAGSVEDVDALAADDDRVTVERAADKKREELS